MWRSCSDDNEGCVWLADLCVLVWLCTVWSLFMTKTALQPVTPHNTIKRSIMDWMCLVNISLGLMFVKFMFFAIETHSRRGTHGKRRERREREINSRRRQCINMNSAVYSFTLSYICLGARLSNFIFSRVTCPRRYLPAEEMTSNIWLH